MDNFSVIIAIGSDHAGVEMKAGLIEKLGLLGYQFKDFGPATEASMDYPDTAHPLSKAVDSGIYNYGILICGSGNGVAIVANKYKGIRAAICWKRELALLARQHNDANILVLPARFITVEEAVEFATFFLITEFEGGRHLRRVEKISQTM